MPRYKGTYLSEARAKAYVLAAGAKPEKILAEVHPIRIEGRYAKHCMWCYKLIDIQYQLNRANITKHPDPCEFLTRWQRSKYSCQNHPGNNYRHWECDRYSNGAS